MERKIITTKDGSSTIEVPQWNVTYHSLHGALQESMHVFIQAGLHYVMQQNVQQPLYVFEMGFGTGLNAFLTAIEAQKASTNVQYTAVELYPLSENEITTLNYKQLLHDHQYLFQQLHQCPWNQTMAISDTFTLQKVNCSLISYTTDKKFHLIYYDAFAPAAQPELWTQAVFEKLYNMLADNGVLVTYCSKGDVRRAMQGAGFTVTKLPGPPGKREIVRAAHLAHP